MKAARILPVTFHLCKYSVLTFSIALTFTLMLAAATAAPAHAGWLPDGALVYDDGISPHIVSDGAGGTFVVWEDNRFGTTPIYGQRLDGSGNPCWTADGIQISDTGSFTMIDLVSDGAGGAIAVYIHSGDMWAQRFDSDGDLLWGPTGVEVTGSCAFIPDEILVVPDKLGGFLTAFKDVDVIYAQRVDTNGNLSWDEVTGRGAVVCGDNDYFDIVSDGMGGVFAVYTTSGGDLLVQRVYASGAVWDLGGILVGIGIFDGAYENPAITVDGYGGVMVVCQGNVWGWDLKAQRLDGAGNIKWLNHYGDPVAVIICQTGGDQHDADILSDGMGGAYIVWQDEREEYLHSQIYAQHIDMHGTPLWALNGILVGDDDDHQLSPLLLECGGGVIATWVNHYTDDRLTGQKLDAGGSSLWQPGGEILAHGYSGEYDLCSDGAGGVFVAYMGVDMPTDGIYAQYTSYKGEVPTPHPTISSVTDVPADQGGEIRLTVAASDYDVTSQLFVQVARYDVWQRVDGALYPAAAAQAAALTEDRTTGGMVSRSFTEDIIAEVGGNIIIESSEGRFLLTAPTGAIPAGTWELVGSFDASQSVEYIYRTSTLADSTSAGIPYNVYLVSAHTEDPAYWYISQPDSGYSVDNLPPGVPTGIAGEQNYAPEGLALAWDPNTENDLSHYAVYRGTSENFIPGAGNLVATPEGESWFDAGWDWQQDYWYKLAAVDENGNESGYLTMGPGEVTGEDPRTPPPASYLSQNYPNPFNPSTTILFGLASASRVSLKVYDSTGRLVRVVLDEDRGPGHYRVTWDGLTAGGRKAASGVYFFHLTAESFTETRKMILMR